MKQHFHRLKISEEVKAGVIRRPVRALIFLYFFYLGGSGLYNYPHQLLKGQMINRYCYAIFLEHLRLEVKLIHLVKKKVLLYLDNVLVFTCAVLMMKIFELKFEWLLFTSN